MHNPCVHIIDDDETVRRALSFFVGEAGFASRTYGSAEQFLSTAGELEPGCVVTDVMMPGMSGVELVQRLRADGLRHAVVVMSGRANVSLAVEAMKAGAADFLQKPFKANALVNAVRGALAERLPETLRTAATADFIKAVDTLTPRQREVLKAIVDGKRNKEIARTLGISPRTVETHRAEIMARTRLPTSGELVRMAVMSGLHLS
ncbi:MAG: response regulator transcription factor [Phenylobacterium sp.]